MSISYLLQTVRASQLVQLVKNLPASAGNQEAQVWSLGWEDSWRRKWQPTPVFLPWEIPWTEEPGGLQSVGSQKSGHNCAHTHTRKLLCVDRTHKLFLQLFQHKWLLSGHFESTGFSCFVLWSFCLDSFKICICALSAFMLQNTSAIGGDYILSPCLFNFYAEYIMRNAGLE